MNEYFLKLYRYNDWANHTVLKLLERSQVTDEYALKNFSHVLNAQFIWFRRVANHANDYKIWDILSFEKMHQSIPVANILWMDYLAQATPEEFAREITYTNSAGDTFHNVVQDCIAHQVNHATYHRAQVAKRLRDVGVLPINTDYITYCRLTDG